ncbi:unnamed protein product, partial [Amoebophrya sp. A25]
RLSDDELVDVATHTAWASMQFGEHFVPFHYATKSARLKSESLTWLLTIGEQVDFAWAHLAICSVLIFLLQGLAIRRASRLRPETEFFRSLTTKRSDVDVDRNDTGDTADHDFIPGPGGREAAFDISSIRTRSSGHRSRSQDRKIAQERKSRVSPSCLRTAAASDARRKLDRERDVSRKFTENVGGHEDERFAGEGDNIQRFDPGYSPTPSSDEDTDDTLTLKKEPPDDSLRCMELCPSFGSRRNKRSSLRKQATRVSA